MAEPKRTIRLRAETERAFKVEVRGQLSRLHEDFYHTVLLWPWWRFFVFVGSVYLAMNTLFALVYLAAPGSIAGARPGSFEDAFFFSVQTLATIGYGVMAPATRFGHIVVTLEALTGIFGVALITGMTFAKFARPTARVLFGEKAVVTRRNGVPHLMFRMANWRRNMVVEAQLRASIVLEEITAEGEVMRRSIDLSLVKDRTSVFALTWTAMHLIDESSPFYGEGALEKLRAQKAWLNLVLLGTDDTFGQTIHARHIYRLEDIAWWARFVDVVFLNEDTRIIDYSRFHEVIPQGDAPSP